MVFAITLCLCGLGAAYVSNDFKIASACAAAVGALWFLFRSLKATIRYKELDNRPLVAMDVERRNLEYDIEKLESQKKYLPADLADLATDELTDITGQSPEEATALIMTARAHWFLDAEVAEADKPPVAQEQ